MKTELEEKNSLSREEQIEKSLALATLFLNMHSQKDDKLEFDDAIKLYQECIEFSDGHTFEEILEELKRELVMLLDRKMDLPNIRSRLNWACIRKELEQKKKDFKTQEIQNERELSES